MSKNDSVLVNFNCPTKLLENFDKAIKGYYSSRTAAFHDLMRKFNEEMETKKQ